MVEANPEATYEVPFAYKKYFNTEQITEMIQAFQNYDTSKDGKIDAKEFKSALAGMGHNDVTDEQVQKMLQSVDKNNDGVIEWLEFLDMMQSVKSSGQNFGQAVMTKSGAAAASVEGATGGHHNYLLEEVSSIARTVNRVCKEDALI